MATPRPQNRPSRMRLSSDLRFAGATICTAGSPRQSLRPHSRRPAHLQPLRPPPAATVARVAWTDCQPIQPAVRRDLTGAPAAGAPAVPISGRTWYCRFCGMQSETADRCTWCHQDLKSLPPSGGKPLRVSHSRKCSSPRRTGCCPLRPDRKEHPGGNRAARTELKPPSGRLRPQRSRHLGTVPVSRSSAHSRPEFEVLPDKVYDPVSRSHYDADSGAAELETPAGRIVAEETNDLRQLTVFSSLFAVIVSLYTGLIGHALPSRT